MKAKDKKSGKNAGKNAKGKKVHAYVAPKPPKPSVWARVAPGLGMLRYYPEIKPIKSTALARRIKNPSACIVAPVYATVEEFHEWSSHLVDDIFEVANELHRTTRDALRLRANSTFPVQCVSPTFFLNRYKVTILVRQCQTSSILRGGITTPLGGDQIQMVSQLLSDNHGVVAQCNGNTYAFWSNKNKYFGLVPEGFGSEDNYTPALLKSQNLQTLIEQSVQRDYGEFNLYSVKVINKTKAAMTLDNINAELEPPELVEVPSQSSLKEQAAEPTPAPTERKKDRKKTEEVEPEEQGLSEDVVLNYSADYKDISDSRGILFGKEFCKEPERILHTNVAAAIFLQHFPANLWTTVIIRDIIKLGKRIFYDSEDEGLLSNDDWMDRIKCPIRFARMDYSVNFDKSVFGIVGSTDPGVLSVEQGLMKFFEGNDTGLLVGPQMVLVWQQKKNYFMFDPKERDGLGRKWTRMFSAELGSTALMGSACVTWYRHPTKLAEVYTDNVALKHRKDPYRIVKLRLFETFTKLEDEGNWIGMTASRWILVGTKTICDYSFAEDKLRAGKAVCMAIIALVYAVETPTENWENTTIDNILLEGIDLLKQSLPTYVADKPFTLHSIKKLSDLGDRRLRLSFVEGTQRGPMLGEGKTKGSLPLKTGINDFFDGAQYGLFTVKDIALAIWHGEDNYFYIFYPYEKLFGLPPQCLCVSDSSLPPMGLANSMRFKNLLEMYSFMSSCLNTKEADEYCLSAIDIGLSEAAARPPLQAYSEYGETGAMLRPFKDLHEGHDIYGVRADKQTIANLLIALGFNKLHSSARWNKEDLADILNIGDKIFCKIFMGLPECQSRDYQLQWDDVVPMIGINKFTFTRDPIEGVLEIIPEPMGEEMEQEMNIPEEYEEEQVEEQDDENYVRPTDAGPITRDLQGILRNWDSKKSEFHEAVVETPFYRMAIWKRDDMYFIFDPKASGENGELTERRIEIGKDKAAEPIAVVGKEPAEGDEETVKPPPPVPLEEQPLYIEKPNYKMYDNEGSAYVAWFADFDEFINYIAEKVPPEYKNIRFTLHDIHLTGIPAGTEDFAYQLRPGFLSISPNHSIIRGSITQNDVSLVNRNKAEFTNCMVAIAFGKITPSQKMTTTLLDVILKYGDRLCSKSLTALKKNDREKYCDLEKLSVDDISPIFSIYRIRFIWKVNSTLTGNMLINELRKATGRFGSIEAGSAMILSHKGYLMAFWRSEGNFYLYDPYETNPYGMLSDSGLPSLSKFLKIDFLLNYMVSKFICVSGVNTFIMYSINIKSSAVEELNYKSVDTEENIDKTRMLEYIPKNQEPFQPYQGVMRILKSPLSSDKMPTHGLAVAALVHSRLHFVELWDYNVAKRLTFLSKYLLQKSNCEMERRSPSTSFDGIRCSFAMDNDILCHVAFSKNIQGPIFSSKRTEIVGTNLQNALTMFFRNCYHIVITMPGLSMAFALWKENGKYYLFGVDKSRPEIYVISSPTLPQLYEAIKKRTHPSEDLSNWYELRSVNVITVPIVEGICKPLKIVEKYKAGPLQTRDSTHDYADSKESQYYDHIAEKPEARSVKLRPSEFVPMGRGTEVLYSNEILRGHRFYGTKDFFTSLQAACVQTSAFSRIKSPLLWTKKTLEKILSAGVNLYVNTVALKGTPALHIVDFRGNLFISNIKLEVCPLTPTTQPALKDDLLMCLTWILRKYQTAYLYTEQFCFTLILENNQFFLYFPGSSEIYCEDLRKGCSCLIKFCTISELLDQLLSNGRISLCENISIGPIYVTRHSK